MKTTYFPEVSKLMVMSKDNASAKFNIARNSFRQNVIVVGSDMAYSWNSSDLKVNS